MGKFLRTYALCFLLAMTVENSPHEPYFDDTIRRFIVSVQNAFCETRSKCTSQERRSGQTNTAGNLTLDRFTTRPPVRPSENCCDTCSCSPDCFKRDTCCPEMLNTIPKVPTRKHCSRSQLRPYSDQYPNARHRYIMLKGCSVGFDKMKLNDPFRKMCETPDKYKTLDTKVPVTDLKSGAVYINRYCALCNMVLEENLLYWKPEIKCVNSSLTAPNMNKIVTEVVESVGCNIVYRAPEKVYVQECKSYISSCNVTGLWTQYDPIVVEACDAYSSTYNFNYRNVFCYICNTIDETGPNRCTLNELVLPNTKTVAVSFSAILRFRPHDTPSPFSGIEPSECRVDQFFDELMEVCRNISCFPPREYINGTCINPFEDISGVTYRFFIKLTPLRIIASNEIIILQEDIKRFVSTLRINLFLPLEFQITRIFVKFKVLGISGPSLSVPQCMSNNDQATEPDVVEYFLIQMDVDIPAGFGVNSSFIDQILLIDETTVSLKSSLGYDIGFHASFIIANFTAVDGLKSSVDDSVSNEIFCEQTRGEVNTDALSGPTDTRNNESPVKQTRPRHDGQENKGNSTGAVFLRDMEIRNETATNDSNVTHENDMDKEKPPPGNFTGNEMMPNNDERSISENYKAEVLTPSNVCPLISLPEQEFHITRYRWGIQVKQLIANISRAKYVEMDTEFNNMSIFVCESFYQNITKTLLFQIRKKMFITDDTPQAMLSLICTCLSVVCSILTLVTYAIFKELRTQPGMNNVMLISSLICAQILFQFGIGQVQTVPSWFCETIGVLIHFSWLLTLMWMNVCSIHMFRVFRSLKQISSNASVAKTTLTYTLYSIVMSTIPVVINIVVSQFSDGSMGYGGGLCYITSYKMIGYLFAIPAGLVVVINMVLFLGVIITISKMPEIDSNASKTRNFAKIYIKISTLTGVTWIFGFLFAFTEIEVLEYIFIILNAGLGVFIFLSFVCNKRVFVLYARNIRPVKVKYSESTHPSRDSTFSSKVSQTDTNSSTSPVSGR